MSSPLNVLEVHCSTSRCRSVQFFRKSRLAKHLNVDQMIRRDSRREVTESNARICLSSSFDLAGCWESFATNRGSRVRKVVLEAIGLATAPTSMPACTQITPSSRSKGYSDFLETKNWMVNQGIRSNRNTEALSPNRMKLCAFPLELLVAVFLVFFALLSPSCFSKQGSFFSRATIVVCPELTIAALLVCWRGSVQAADG